MGETTVWPQVFGLTSAVPNEGKSTMASNLSAAMAMARYCVLLIDADTRKSSFYDRFGVQKSPDLCKLIQSHGKFEDYVQKTDLEDLDILTTGERTEQPSELFFNDRLE